MKVLKRNQIIISVLALMLITVGYMSYTSNVHNTIETGALMDSEKYAGIGDAKLVSSNNVQEAETAESATNTEEKNEQSSTSASSISTENESESSTNVNNVSSNKNKESTESSETEKTTSASAKEVDYFATSRLERDKMYSQMLETYQGLVESSTIATEQKNISTQEIANINNRKNSIMIAENLIKNLGFEDVIIFVNDTSTSVIVKADKLEDADVAKIQNIVCREIGVDTESIHISLK